VSEAAYLPNRAENLAFLDIRSALVETGKKASRRAHYRIRRTLREIKKKGNVGGRNQWTHDNISVPNSNNFAKHSEDIILVFQISRIGYWADEKKVILIS
jgi:hypothetical protein